MIAAKRHMRKTIGDVKRSFMGREKAARKICRGGLELSSRIERSLGFPVSLRRRAAFLRRRIGA